jgi:hypothetical protein
MLRICLGERKVAPFEKRLGLAMAGEAQQIEDAVVKHHRCCKVADADRDVVNRAHRCTRLAG